MGRTSKPLKTKRLTIVLTEQVYKALEDLTDGGFAGKSPTETAEEMVRRGIESLSNSESLIAESLRKRTARRR